MCSHRKQILVWDSSKPSVTIIPTWWLWQIWSWFDSLTCSCMGHKLSKSLRLWGSGPLNVSLLKPVSGKCGDICWDQYNMAICNHAQVMLICPSFSWWMHRADQSTCPLMGSVITVSILIHLPLWCIHNCFVFNNWHSVTNTNFC